MLSLKPGESQEVKLPASAHKGALEGRPEFRFSEPDVASLVSDGERHVITAGRNAGRVDLVVFTRRRDGDEVKGYIDTIAIRIGGKPAEDAGTPELPGAAVPIEAAEASTPRGRKKAAAAEEGSGR